MSSLTFPHDIELKEFVINGKRIIYDVTGAYFFKAEEPLFSILSLGREYDRDGVLNALTQRYPLPEIEECEREIEEHRRKGLLLTKVETGCLKPCEKDGILNNLLLAITTRCNLKCGYCFMKGKNSAEEDMRLGTAIRSVDFLLSELERNGQREGLICFFGGEPLLRFECIRDTVEHAVLQGKSRGIDLEFSITTNGSLLTPSMVKFLKNYDFSVTIGIDGPPSFEARSSKRERDVHHKVMSALPYLLEQMGDRVAARATCTAINNDPLAIYEYLRKTGFREIQLGPCFYSPDRELEIREESQIDSYLDGILAIKRREVKEGYYSVNILDDLRRIKMRTLRLFACGYGRTFLSVDPTGTVYSCYRFFGSDQFALGDIWRGIDPSLRRGYFETVDNHPLCKKCWLRYHCGGGCPGDHMEVNGDHKVPSSLFCYLKKKGFHRLLSLYLGISRKKRDELVRVSIERARGRKYTRGGSL